MLFPIEARLRTRNLGIHYNYTEETARNVVKPEIEVNISVGNREMALWSTCLRAMSNDWFINTSAVKINVNIIALLENCGLNDL